MSCCSSCHRVTSLRMREREFLIDIGKLWWIWIYKQWNYLQSNLRGKTDFFFLLVLENTQGTAILWGRGGWRRSLRRDHWTQGWPVSCSSDLLIKGWLPVVLLVLSVKFEGSSKRNKGKRIYCLNGWKLEANHKALYIRDMLASPGAFQWLKSGSSFRVIPLYAKGCSCSETFQVANLSFVMRCSPFGIFSVKSTSLGRKLLSQPGHFLITRKLWIMMMYHTAVAQPLILWQSV